MKKRLLPIWFGLLFFGLTRCDSDSTTYTASSPPPSNNETTARGVGKDSTGQAATPTTQQCELKGSVLEDNTFWIKDAQTLVAIVADETTKDVDFGDSHRIFVAINTENCATILRQTLPVNGSPDFPWYLNTNTYEPNHQLVCMQGVEFIYCYDVPRKRLLERLEPTFLNKRIPLDAQSGTPAGMEIWQQYLLGYAFDMGACAFDLRDKSSIHPVLPQAEYYSDNHEGYHSLFLLEDQNGLIQALIPDLNEDQDRMIVHRLFPQPQAIQTNISENVRDNRYIILNSKDKETKTAIDMEEMKAVQLPTDVASKNAKAILDWLRQH